jgi:hypothetical protein
MYDVEESFSIRFQIGNTGSVMVDEDSVIVDSDKDRREVEEIFRENGDYYISFYSRGTISADDLSENLNSDWWVKQS